MHPGSQKGHAGSTGNHLQFLSWGFPREGAATGCANTAGSQALSPLGQLQEGEGAGLGCRGAN